VKRHKCWLFNICKAGVVLGWIGVAVPVVFFVVILLAVAPHHLWVVIPAVFVILVLSALVIYTRRNNRK